MAKRHAGMVEELWRSLYDTVTAGRSERTERAHELYHSFKAKMLSQRSPFERLADTINESAGSVDFLALHAVWFAVWILINTGVVPIVPPFDPFPFGLLTMVVSLEAIFLSIFVLISQGRAGGIADIRDEVNFQINLQAEQEVTKLLRLVKEIHENQGLALRKDAELERMVQRLNPDDLTHEIEAELGMPETEPKKPAKRRLRR